MVKSKLSLKHLIVITIIGLLLALTGINGMRLFHLMMPPPEEELAQSAIPQLNKAKKIPSPQVIASWNLFGQNVVKAVQAPKTSLRLKLIGIISSTASSQARAIVEDSSRKQKHYKVGDEIKKNVTVKSIHPDHIVIVHNSRDEIVQLNTLKDKKSMIKKVVIQ